MNILSKIHQKAQNNFIPIIIIVLIIPLILIIILPGKNYYPYRFQENVSTIPFTTDDNGYMYVRASFNDTSGLFFVDTGSDITTIKESLVNTNDSMYFKKLTDAQNISDRKKMVRISNFKIGDIEFPSLTVWPSDLKSWDENGFFNQKDSVIGVIGSDIYSHFVWEFNMGNRLISIYQPGKYPVNIPDSLSVPLLKKGSGYFTEIKISDNKHTVKFDSGCSSSLIMQDTFAYLKNNFKSYNTSKRGNQLTFFSHLKKDTFLSDTSFCCIIPKVMLGKDTIESVICNERAKTNLLGVPFFWSYKKVVANYPNKKLYFINQKKEVGLYDIGFNTNKFVKNSFLNQHGLFRIKSSSYEKYEVLLISQNKLSNTTEVPDTISTCYKIYGESRWWGKSINTIDSILCLDSVILLNGIVKYDNFKIYSKDNYFYDN